MKKLIAAVMAVAMLLSLMPITVMADDEDVSLPVTKLYVGTVNALENPEGDGWSFDAETDTLTLNNCTLTESMLHVQTDEYGTDRSDAMIYVEGDLTIELIGTNSVERVIEEEPTDYTQYYAILAAIYETDVNGETWDYPSRLSFTGTGSLTAGIAITGDAWDAENWSLIGDWYEYLEFSAAIGCWAEGSADFTGLHGGGQMDIYGGIIGAETPWNIRAFACSPTFGDNCIVTAYQDIEGNIENESGYNWNNNDAWRLKIVTGDAILNSNGQLILMDSGAAAGYGWTWENKVLTLAADTEVKAVDFRSGLGSAKLVLAGDVTLDSTGMGYDSNWNDISPISTACDLEINADAYTLTFTGESNTIFSHNADVIVSGGTLEENAEYSGGISITGGSLTIQDAIFRSPGGINVNDGYDEDWNTVPGGDILIKNASVTLDSPIESYGNIVTVLNSDLTVTRGYSCVYAPNGIYLQDSNITLNASGTAIDTNETVSIDNCNLNIVSEQEVISCGYVSYNDSDTEADLSKLNLANMNITEPAGYQILAVESNWGAKNVKLANADGMVATALIAQAAKAPAGCAHVYENNICTNCGKLYSYSWALTADAVVNLSLSEDLYVDLNGYDLTGIIALNGNKVHGMDSTTNEYTCENMGYFSCVDENGNAIIPESLYTTDDMIRYMTIGTDHGYTFHRFYLGITHVSLAPNVTGFGYRAEFYGDEMVQDQVVSIGYNLWLTEDRVVSRTTAFKNVLTLRLKNFDVANYGETPVNACVTMILTDGTVTESATASYSMRKVVEQINQSYASFDDAKISAIQAMIANNPVMESWQIENIRKK